MDMVTANINKLHGYYFEDLEVGMEEVFVKTITDADIITFAGISGDTNPIHLNHEFANKTIFEGRIAHGMLTASFISTVIGTKLPGPGCIYISQNLRFRAPVRPGDTVTATCTITGLSPQRRFADIKTVCTCDDTVVVDGEATVRIPTHNK
jgi:3-hydroxybutyryl-CoA dehydratase